uniref:Uncharacterized protein n=1 Tax=Malurus cyaneus samueli TaxID=2593467 RepID=A0A8C5U2W0_9PASS
CNNTMATCHTLHAALFRGLDLLLCHPGITDQGWTAPVPSWDPWFGLDLLLCHPGIPDQGWICSCATLGSLTRAGPCSCATLGSLTRAGLLLCHPGIPGLGWICSCAILGSLVWAGSAPVPSWDH